ncbi:carbohydrate kinase [Oenococcus oeni IOEB_C23]|uniref:NAD(P)H-hydrate epimerase n=1 Tax=Oenococcus oeni TaxID=1247 RepID=UPI00050EEF26|nr:NAD(P)H-hydrate epimerase [Oenococcus oeni]KGH65801.1 carbohydrate kinase [Oenococcus oeni IOEB_C23]
MTTIYISSKQAHNFDDYTINKIGVPSSVLMERAALAVCQRLLESRNFNLKKVLVVAGIGNNGGDGIAVARMLYLKQVPVKIYLLGDREKISKDSRIQLKIAENYGVPFVSNIDDLSSYTTIVDAVFGVGLSRDVTGEIAGIVDFINNNPASVMAVDMPTGLNADNGNIMGTAVKAAETVTMSYNKLGLISETGRKFAGVVTAADIGIYEP